MTRTQSRSSAGMPRSAMSWRNGQGFAVDPRPVSPPLVKRHDSLLRPLGRGFGDLPGLFGESLPDGWGRLLIDRELAAHGRAAVDVTDPDRLALVGTDGMGALIYQPADDPEPHDAIDLDWFGRLVSEVGTGVAADDLERLRAMAGASLRSLVGWTGLSWGGSGTRRWLRCR